jgi:hypothetical protein
LGLVVVVGGLGEKNKDIIKAKVEGMYQDQNISLLSFGVGNDFDEDLMKGIGLKGMDCFSTSQIPTILQLRSTKALVASPL